MITLLSDIQKAGRFDPTSLHGIRLAIPDDAGGLYSLNASQQAQPRPAVLPAHSTATRAASNPGEDPRPSCDPGPSMGIRQGKGTEYPSTRSDEGKAVGVAITEVEHGH